MKTEVKNILKSQDVDLFVNNLEPKENLISSVILKRGMAGQLLNKEVRHKIESELDIVSKVSKNGDKIAFSEKANLFARQFIY
jgi:hypothetical protein